MKPMLALTTVLLGGSFASAEEAKWVSIFNGKDLTGWTPKIRGEEVGKDPKKTFIVKDGAITVDYSKYKEWGEAYGHLFYHKKLSHYRIRVEYRFSGEQIEGGPGWAKYNSGIMLHCQAPETMGKDQSFPVSMEFQLLGKGNGVPTNGNLCTPGTYATIDGSVNKSHCINSKSPSEPLGEWVVAEAEVRGGKIIHHLLNGKTVFTYTDTKLDENDGDAKPLIEIQGNNDLTEGYISLQSESSPVQFRKVEIQELEP